MNKILILLVVAVLAFTMIFGCTGTGANTDNNTANNGGTTPTGNNSSNPVNGAGTGEIPTPPALPE
ncbi:MAG: hypothetical protein NTZ73_03225 [Candidatus Diapherotrites archaeon]|nr:hypothetical protein [Candidatus Diapherotrites archaeon]